MKVMLINAKTSYVKVKAVIPLGLLSIATYLTENGHTVQIYDRAIDGGSVKKHLDSFCPEIVGISSLGSRSLDDALKVSRIIKKHNLPVVWGGHMPSLIPELLLKSGIVDFVVIGDGEITFLDLLNSIINKTSLYDVDGLAFIENSEVVINKDRELVDLSQLPIIDFSYVDPSKYFTMNFGCQRMLYIYTSKGCPCQCTYCYNPRYSKGVWRARPKEYYLSEIKYLIENFEMDGVLFADDLLVPNRGYLNAFCNNIIDSNLNFIWGCEIRSDICNKDDLQLMFDSGCRWIFFGIESGSEERQKTIKKKLNLKKTKETIEACKEIGIVTLVGIIIGFPNETEEELKENIGFFQDLNADIKIPNLYGPIPKSELFDYLVSSKMLDTPKSVQEWEKIKLMDYLGKNYSKISDRDLKVIYGYFNWMSFIGEYSNNKKESRVIVKKAFGEILNFLKQGTLSSLYMIFLSAKQFFGIIFYAKLFPKIRKKYGLTKKTAKRHNNLSNPKK